ncbi:hypothetical protein O7610_09535 [Solwaraspora sp. WMMA2065]|nr:hypothetical protein [Solwaraspora sp. WMMA2065]WJK36556.1 hypothetical protein O7610_09535 [Solwaraspora sp. WMMA2065]
MTGQASSDDAPDPRTGLAATRRAELAAAQRALVASLVDDTDPPPGFDPYRLSVARTALLRKRAGEVARHWPLLAASLGDAWPAVFVRWATGRRSAGGLRDGWDFVRALAASDRLPGLAVAELAGREAGWCYDGSSAPRRRRLPAVRRLPGGWTVQVAGRVRTFGLRR